MNWYAKPRVEVENYSCGMKYYRFVWAGGVYISVTDELAADCDPAYMSFLGLMGNFGPWKLQYVGDLPEYKSTHWYCNFKSLHNQIVPKIYPLYVRWVEFWRWVVTKQFRWWLKEKAERFVLWLAFGF